MSGFGSWPELLNRPQFAILTSFKYHFLYSAFQRKSEFCINVLTDIVSDPLNNLVSPDNALYTRHQCLVFFNKCKIGVDFALKVLNWNDDTLIRLQLWDIAGNVWFTYCRCIPNAV
jgi:hypothetical protein